MEKREPSYTVGGNANCALDLDVVLSPCYPFRDQKKLGECVHRGMDLISDLLKSLSASCDSRFMNMHSDKQVA